jgi:hypothetical protein
MRAPEKFLHSLYASASGNEPFPVTEVPPPVDVIIEETTNQVQQAANFLQTDPALGIFLMFIASAFLVVLILYSATRFTRSHKALSTIMSKLS